MAAGGVTHPPGGATALIAVVGGDGVRALGWWYVLNVMVGAVVLVAVALLNNTLQQRRYPRYW
jgi:CBS-domain-containing membrane protein